MLQRYGMIIKFVEQRLEEAFRSAQGLEKITHAYRFFEDTWLIAKRTSPQSTIYEEMPKLNIAVMKKWDFFQECNDIYTGL